jgi:microcystin-dependent protein
MSTPYIGEIKLFAGNFAPVDWAFCNGQLLPISEYEALFSLIGTTYGGDGITTFALPDLRGRVPIHQGMGYPMGQSLGEEQVALQPAQLPEHTHPLIASIAPAQGSNPTGSLLGVANGFSAYAAWGAGPTVALSDTAIGTSGGGAPHDNMQPFLPVSFIISLFGIFPQQG